MNKKQKKLLLRIIIAALFFVPLYLISEGIIKTQLPSWAVLVLFLIPYLIVGCDILRKAFLGIKNGQVFDENFLMTIATIGAIVIGEYGEGVAVMLLYQIGELFQSCAVGKSRRNITALMDIRPDYANIEEGGELVQVDPEDVEVGSIIVVKPGERIPLDGVVEEGVSTLDTSALTGESLPRKAEEGSIVLSGSINMSGVLKVRTTSDFEGSTASRILDLVENAASRKSRSENFISRFAKYYTPIVCIAALALAVLPPAFILLSGRGLGGYASASAVWGDWVLRACSFLVISCPCAIVISVPLSFFAGLGGAGSQGILIKGSNYLEELSRVKTIAFDKTGTITRGNFAVTLVHKSPIDEEKLLEFAAHAECHSTHPIARSIREAYGKFIDINRVSNVEELSGHGIMADVDGVRVAVGNEMLLDMLGVEHEDCPHAGTVIHVVIGGVYSGHIVIADEVKPNSAQAIADIKRSGVEKIVMLTGDTASVAKDIAAQVGIEDYRAELLPEAKVACVEELLEQKDKNSLLAFVGDGLNDAPVLSRADLGIAMGALGSDAAIEAADIVLMDDDPAKIAKAIKISKKCTRIVKQNIVFAIAVKILCLVLSALDIANMWVAIAADVGVMIIAVLNAVRCLFVKDL